MTLEEFQNTFMNEYQDREMTALRNPYSYNYKRKDFSTSGVFKWDKKSKEWYTDPLDMKENNRWYGKGFGELIVEYQSLIKEEIKINNMLDDLKQHLGKIPQLESKIDKLNNSFKDIEDSLSSLRKNAQMIKEKLDKYVECEETGVLVNKDVAQAFSVLSSEYTPSRYWTNSIFIGFTASQARREENVTAYTVYLAPTVDMKKFKKQHGIK